jgi:hypothetical protein
MTRLGRDQKANFKSNNVFKALRPRIMGPLLVTNSAINSLEPRKNLNLLKNNIKSSFGRLKLSLRGTFSVMMPLREYSPQSVNELLMLNPMLYMPFAKIVLI